MYVSGNGTDAECDDTGMDVNGDGGAIIADDDDDGKGKGSDSDGNGDGAGADADDGDGDGVGTISACTGSRDPPSSPSAYTAKNGHSSRGSTASRLSTA